MLGKEGAKLVERDKVYAIVKIYVAGTRNSDKLLRFCCTLVGVFTEFLRVCLVARNEEHWTG